MRRLATIWLVATMLTAAVGATARAQYDDGLPAGVRQVTVDDQPIDASTTPEVANRNPASSNACSISAIASADVSPRRDASRRACSDTL